MTQPHPVINSSFSREAVAEAMTDAWNTICADTNCHPLDIQHRGRKLYFEAAHWADLTARNLFANYVRSGLAVPIGFIVGNGDGTRWRTWTDMGPNWTGDRDKALRFARREDAEAFCADDEDAWTIQPVHIDGELSKEPKP